MIDKTKFKPNELGNITQKEHDIINNNLQSKNVNDAAKSIIKGSSDKKLTNWKFKWIRESDGEAKTLQKQITNVNTPPQSKKTKKR
jgi:hypothetical protein